MGNESSKLREQLADSRGDIRNANNMIGFQRERINERDAYIVRLEKERQEKAEHWRTKKVDLTGKLNEARDTINTQNIRIAEQVGEIRGLTDLNQTLRGQVEEQAATNKYLMNQNDTLLQQNGLLIQQTAIMGQSLQTIIGQFQQMLDNKPYQNVSTGNSSGSNFAVCSPTVKMSSTPKSMNSTNGIGLPPIDVLLKKANRSDLMDIFVDAKTIIDNDECLNLEILSDVIQKELQKLEKVKGVGGLSFILEQVQDLLKSIMLGCGSGFQCSVCSESVLCGGINLCYCPFGRHTTHCRNKCCSGALDVI